MKTVLFSYLSGTLLFYSCSKNSDAPAAHEITPTANNISGTYNLVGLSLSSDSGSTVDLFNGADLCRQDDSYTLRPNGTLLYTDGGLVCATNNSVPTSWQLIDNKQMRLGTSIYRIQHFTGKHLSIVMDTVVNGHRKKLNRKFMRK